MAKAVGEVVMGSHCSGGPPGIACSGGQIPARAAPEGTLAAPAAAREDGAVAMATALSFMRLGPVGDCPEQASVAMAVVHVRKARSRFITERSTS